MADAEPEGRRMPGRRVRPSRARTDAAALALLGRHGPQVMATARRYSATPEDAEDAYQRGLEILLTKAPTTREDELVPWLKTVVKHEAWALRRQRQRATPTTDDGELRERAAEGSSAHDRAERLERLGRGVEALGRLKPQEVRALVLRGEGYSYKEIQRITGWSYTKVNRCLTEGRSAFLERVAGIEAGAECERLAPRLSALADGEATADDLAALRPHLRSCLSCRSRLREFRDVPSRVAALVPPAALVASDGGGARSALESLMGAAHQRAAAWGERVPGATELATGGKVAAVAASAAALAGGGAATMDQAGEQPAVDPKPALARPVSAKELKLQTAEAPATNDGQVGKVTTPEPAPARAAPLTPPRPVDPAAAEFTPGGGGGPVAGSSEFERGGTASAGGSGGGEFGP